MFNTQANTPAYEITNRLARLQAIMQENSIDAALILQPTDLFYFSGTIQQCHLYIPAEGTPLLFARKSYQRAVAESPLPEVIPISSTKKIREILKARGIKNLCRLGMELDVLPANLYLLYLNLFEQVDIIDISPFIRSVRALKSPFEIEIISEAARRADQVASHVTQLLRPGVTEIELAGQVESFARKLGHQGVVRMRLWGNELFYGHLMSGASAAVPSYLASPTGGASTSPAVAQGPGYKPIGCNEPILVDYVFALNGYIADHTRIFSLGALPDELMKAHEAMRRIQAEIKNAAVTDVPAGTIYEMAVGLAAESGFADHFMGVESDSQRIRFVGHGIGLELDEYPFLAKGQKMVLEKGMVIALEPKCIFPGKGVVGVENSFVVRENGLEQLTTYPDDVIEIECKKGTGT